MIAKENELVLGVTTCDKCGKRMEKGQQIVTIALSKVANSDSEVITPEPEIRYACHLACWDGVEVDY
jgi:hypothetical protein